MRIAAVFGTRDKIIVNVIRESIDVPVKWYFSFEEILQAETEFDWVIASTSAPCQSDISEAVERLRKISNRLILFAKEPLFDDEKTHWIVGKHFTVREIKNRLQELIQTTPKSAEQSVESVPETKLNTTTLSEYEVPSRGVILAVGQDDIEARLEEANAIIIGRAVNATELKNYMETLQPKTIILSIRLPGLDSPKEVVADILAAGYKLVFLAGDTDPDEPWILSLQSQGIPVVFDPIKVSDLLEAINGPEFGYVPPQKAQNKSKQRLKSLIPQGSFQEQKQDLNNKQVGIPGIQILNKAKDMQIFRNLGQKYNRSEPHIANSGRPSLQTRVFIVVGVDTRVGATSFAIALTEAIKQANQPVELLDAGGGASEWLNNNTRKYCPPFSVVPGVITIVDAGLQPPEELMPFTEAVFVVTDLSRNAINLDGYKRYRTFLVGTRGAKEHDIRQLASLWHMEVLCCLPEDPYVREAEQARTASLPKSWQKQLYSITTRILEGGM